MCNVLPHGLLPSDLQCAVAGDVCVGVLPAGGVDVRPVGVVRGLHPITGHRGRLGEADRSGRRAVVS